MSAPLLSRKLAADAVKFVSGARADGFEEIGTPSALNEGWRRYCRARKAIARMTFASRVERGFDLYRLKPSVAAGKKLKHPYRAKVTAKVVGADEAADAVIYWLRREQKRHPLSRQELSQRTKLPLPQIDAALKLLTARGVNVQQIGDRYDIPSHPPTGRMVGDNLELVSRPDNTFLIAGIGDLHAASKYCRWDVREDMIRRAEKKGVQAIFDTGNWIDGEARFNRYELEVVGLEQQCQMLARRHPKTSIPIYAIAGDDHEGWYAQREGIDVGRYAEGIMRAAGHDWHNLGFLEAEVVLRNANSGKSSKLLIVHPGGGAAYALSYHLQKAVESLEGGEKPAVALYGHNHKLWAGLIRNVWVAQTGCAQDQSSFMRKKRIEAHVGGLPWIELEQDPRTGAILAMTAPLVRYFNTGYYKKGRDRWSHHGPIRAAKRAIGGISA